MNGITPGRMMELAHDCATAIQEMDREPNREKAVIRMETKIYGALRQAVLEAERGLRVVVEEPAQ